MSKIILSLIILLISTELLSAEDIKCYIGGVVQCERSKADLEFASIYLKNEDGSIIAEQMSDQNGKFIFKLENQPKQGSYIEISMVGYEAYKAEIKFQKSKSIYNLRVIQLKNTSLDAAVVSAKSNIKPIEDGYVYSVSKDLSAQKTKILDLYTKLPFIELDHEYKVKYFGVSSNIGYLINGKRSNLTSSEAVSKMVEGSNIQSIELITDMPLGYENKDVLINIITKKESLFQGIVSNISLDGEISKNHYGLTPAIDIATSFKKSTLTIRGVYGSSRQLSDINSYSLRESLQDPENNWAESSISNGSNRDSGNLSINYNYNISKKEQIRASISGDITDNSHYSRSLATSSTQNDIKRNSLSNSLSTRINANLSYRNGVIRSKSYNIDYRLSLSNSKDSTFYDNIIGNNTQLEKQDNDALSMTNIISGGFNIPLNKKQSLNVNTSYTNDYSNEADNRFYYDENRDLYVLNENISTYYDAMQHTALISTGYSFKFKNKSTLSINASLGYYHNGGYINLLKDNKINYSTIIFTPSIRYQIRPAIGSTISLKLFRNQKHPSLYQLNPYINTQDPLYWQTGNPELKTSDQYTFDARWMLRKKKHTFTIFARYTYSFDIISSFTQLLDNGISIRSYKNIANSDKISSKLTYRYMFNKKWSVNLMGNISYNTFRLEDRNNSVFTASIVAGALYNITPYINIKADINTSPSTLVEATAQSSDIFYMIGSSLSINGRTKNNKFNYSLIINNLQNINNYLEKSSIEYDGYRLYTEQTPIKGLFFVSFRLAYSFGNIKK